jgi:hypothetical protein
LDFVRDSGFGPDSGVEVELFGDVEEEDELLEEVVELLGVAGRGVDVGFEPVLPVGDGEVEGGSC